MANCDYTGICYLRLGTSSGSCLLNYVEICVHSVPFCCGFVVVVCSSARKKQLTWEGVCGCKFLIFELCTGGCWSGPIFRNGF